MRGRKIVSTILPILFIRELAARARLGKWWSGVTRPFTYRFPSEVVGTGREKWVEHLAA